MPLFVVLLFTLCFGALAWDEPTNPQPGASLAEYTRLSEEIRSLSKKNKWGGVERAYQEMIETGIPPEAEFHQAGAQAARALGDIAEARDRIELALEVLDIPELQAWLEEFDTSFGPVNLQGDPSKVHLECSELPFDPIQAGAITFAQAQVEETGAFSGLLPAGVYHFGTMEVKVRPGVSTVRIDIRTDRYLRKLERIEKKTGDRTDSDNKPETPATVDIPVHIPVPDDDE